MEREGDDFSTARLFAGTIGDFLDELGAIPVPLDLTPDETYDPEAESDEDLGDAPIPEDDPNVVDEAPTEEPE